MSWKSFLDGFGSIVDIFGFLGPEFPDPNEDGWKIDRDAIASDWQAVGDDLGRAMGICRDKLTKPK